MRWVGLWFAFLVVNSAPAWGTSCSALPVCARVRPGEIVFTGTAQGVVKNYGSDELVRFEVREVFAGLPAGTREVDVAGGQGKYIKGTDYLLQVGRWMGSELQSAICGNTGKIDPADRDQREFLNYLHQRAEGTAPTSLTVSVVNQLRIMPGIAVAITGPGGALRATADYHGDAQFNDIRPGMWTVSGAAEGYHPVETSAEVRTGNVPAGNCEHIWIEMESDVALSGVVLDHAGHPVAGLSLELADWDKSLAKARPTETGYEVLTNPDGRFTIRGVEPGRYVLGTNSLGSHDSPIPSTYFPGSLDRGAAIPVLVTKEFAPSDLTFHLPDYGKRRPFRICVTDEAGQALSGILLVNSTKSDKSITSLAGNLTTGRDGCFVGEGWAAATYQIGAAMRPTEDRRDTLVAQAALIPPGETPAEYVLVAKRVYRSASPK